MKLKKWWRERTHPASWELGDTGAWFSPIPVPAAVYHPLWWLSILTEISVGMILGPVAGWELLDSNSNSSNQLVNCISSSSAQIKKTGQGKHWGCLGLRAIHQPCREQKPTTNCFIPKSTLSWSTLLGVYWIYTKFSSVILEQPSGLTTVWLL